MVVGLRMDSLKYISALSMFFILSFVVAVLVTRPPLVEPHS